MERKLELRGRFGISKSYKAFQISINNDKVLFTNDAGIILCIDLKTKSLLWNKVLVPSENFLA